MYDPEMVKPMREELVAAGFQSLGSADEVDAAVTDGTVLVVVNSVCGCAAGGARPGVIQSLANEKKPAKLTTVFAGVDKEATDKARSYFVGYPPSSPSVALLKDGDVVFILERHNIEGYGPDQIAASLKDAYNKYC